MARQRMVTRTITSHEVTFMTVTVSTKSVGTLTHTFTGESVDYMKYAQKHIDTEDVKCVAVQSVKDNEELWGMREEDFLKYAVRVERNTNKVIDE